MKIAIFASVVACLLITAGCSKAVPACGDESVTNLVKQIAGEEMAKSLGEETAKLFSYSVNAIRTTDTNGKTGARDCAADLEVKASNTGMSQEMPITYTVETTDDGESIYVNVLGL